MKILLQIGVLFTLILGGCSHSHPDTSHFENPPFIVIEDVASAQKGVLYLNKDDFFMHVSIIENTLNDTAIFDLRKIAPGQTGKLYSTDCYTDSIFYFYRPHKATEGKLVLKYGTGMF
jgi:hypothetical protein